MVASEISCRACQVAASVSALHAVDQLLHADAEADIELAGFFENDLAVVDGVEFLLADLEDAGLALAQRQQFQRGVLQRLGAAVFGQQIEVGFDARLRLP